MNNAVRHAAAKTITVRARQNGAAVELSVLDDGTGFDPRRSATGAGRGLNAMRTRAAKLGGALEVQSDPKGGTRVLLTLPLRRG